MNERIKELAERVEIYMGQDSYGKFAVVPGHEKGSISRIGKAESFDALEKFAELIVRECADYVDSAISDGGVDGRSLKEYFRVKE